MDKGADISDCGTYRYRLWRLWDTSEPMVNFILLNPSTADADIDDPTIRRCMGFARDWGYGGIMVTNLFALRSTDPKLLRGHLSPVGLHNDVFLHTEAKTCHLVVAGWGAHGYLGGRGEIVRSMLRRHDITVHHLGLTAAGQPRHPLYLKRDTQPTPWNTGGL